VSQILYRFWNDADELLYIGVTMNFVDRMRTHRREQPWSDQITKITIERFETREDVLAAEKSAIVAESPRYNNQHNSRRRSDLRLSRSGDWRPVRNEQSSIEYARRGLLRQISHLLSSNFEPFDDCEWRQFIRHLHVADTLMDVCYLCRDSSNLDGTHIAYLPVFIDESTGVCGYECDHGHQWSCYWWSAENLDELR